MFDAKLKQRNLATNSYLSAVEQHANKNKERIEKLQVFDSSYFLVIFVLLMMIFKICSFISQHLVC